MKKKLLILLCFLGSLPAYSQKDNYGVEFWTGFLGNLYSYKGDTNQLKLYIAAKQSTKVTVSIPLIGYSVSFIASAGSVTEYKIASKYVFISQSETIEKKGVHIVSDYPIAVSSLNLLNYSTDASVVYPLKSIIPRATYTAVVPDIKDTKSPSQTSVSEMLLVGIEDSTKLQIIPTAETQKGRKANVPYYITINQGETYQINSFDNLDGTKVRVLNKKRLAVYTGNRCSEWPCGACDNQVEQLLANELLDTLYFALPQYGHTGGYWVKVASIDSALWIKINGQDFFVPSGDSALVFEVDNGDSTLRISASRKFSVFQYLKGMNCNGYSLNTNYSPGNAWGDPSLVQLMSHNFYTRTSAFSTMTSSNLGAHYTTILVPSNGINHVYLDGVKVAASGFIKAEFDHAFSYAMLDLSAGAHTIRSDSGHIAYVYGLGLTESYMYLAGYSLPIFNLNVFDSTLAYDCKNSKVTMNFEAQRTGGVDFLWDFGDGNGDTSRVVDHTFKIPGVYKVKVKVLAFNGEKDSFTKVYDLNWPVFNPVYDHILCDTQRVFIETNPFFKDFVWQDKSTNNFFKVTKDVKLKVTAKDTSGFCSFVDSAEIVKVDANPRLFVDTISNCASNNLFKFVDSLTLKNDLISHRILRYSQFSKAYKNSTFDHHFNKAGKFNAYIDVFPARSACKYTYVIPINIRPSAKVGVDSFNDKYCHGDTVTLVDSSEYCCGSLLRYAGLFDDTTFVQSNKGIIKGRVFFDYKTLNATKSIKYFVETSGGCVDTINLNVLVFPPASPVFDLGTDTVKCLLLSRWNFNHTMNTNLAGNYSLLWNFGNGRTGDQTQYKNVRFTDTGFHKITLTTTTDLGCKDSFSRKVKVIEQPVAAFGILDSVQCLTGNKFYMTDASTGKYLSWLWRFEDGTTSSIQNPEKVFSISGKSKVKLIVNSPFAGCFEDSVTHTVRVLSSPKADFSPVNSINCFKDNKVDILDRSTFSNGNGQYFWNSKGQQFSTRIPGTFTYSDTGTFAINLLLIDSMGCRDSITKQVMVKPMPQVMFGVNDTLQCLYGQNFELTQSPVDPNIDSTAWKVDDVWISSNKTKETLSQALSIGKHNITLYAKTAFGCIDSITKQVGVLSAPQANFDFDKDTLCFTAHKVKTNLKAVSQDPVKSFKYIYGGADISVDKELTGYSFAAFGTNSVELKILTSEGCRDSITKDLFLIENPKIEVIGDSACLDDSVNLSFKQISGNYPVINTVWDMGDGTKYNSNSVKHLYGNDGVYDPKLTVSDAFNCVAQNTGKVLIYPKPLPGFKIQILSSDQSYTYVKMIPDNMGYAGYLWSFPDGSSNSGVSPVINFTRFFQDRIQLKTSNAFGCSDTFSQYLFIYPPLENLWIENAFSPNQDQLNEEFIPGNLGGTSDYTLRIYNRWGEMMFVSNHAHRGWDGEYMGKPAPAGVYIFTLEFMYADGKRYTARGNLTLIR